MFKKVISSAAVLAIAFTAAPSAAYTHHWAAPSTLRLHVLAHVLPSCTFSKHKPVDINFGAVDANTHFATQSTDLKYECSKGVVDPKLALSDKELTKTDDYVLRSGHNKLNYHIHLKDIAGVKFTNNNTWASARHTNSLHSVKLVADIPSITLATDPGHYTDIVTATLFF